MHKPYPFFRPKWSKLVPYLRPKRVKNHTLRAAHTYIAYIREYSPSGWNTTASFLLRKRELNSSGTYKYWGNTFSNSMTDIKIPQVLYGSNQGLSKGPVNRFIIYFKQWSWACDQLKTSNLSAENFKRVASMNRYPSPRYDHEILVSGYPVLTAVSWSRRERAISACMLPH